MNENVLVIKAADGTDNIEYKELVMGIATYFFMKGV